MKSIQHILILVTALCIVVSCSPSKKDQKKGDNTSDAASQQQMESDQQSSSNQKEKDLKTIAKIAEGSSTCTYFNKAIDTTKLTNILDTEGPFTVFAPNDKAFKALPDGKWDQLLSNMSNLSNLLKYHVVSGKMTTEDLEDGTELTTVHGNKISVKITQDGAKINQAKIVKPNVNASNGVVHVINKVLIPEK